MSGVKEYRVRWRRAGQTRDRIQIYQTERGAERCVKRQITAREEMTWVADQPLGQPIPEIVSGPVIEAREVGEWSTVNVGGAT